MIFKKTRTWTTTGGLGNGEKLQQKNQYKHRANASAKLETQMKGSNCSCTKNVSLKISFTFRSNFFLEHQFVKLFWDSTNNFRTLF